MMPCKIYVLTSMMLLFAISSAENMVNGEQFEDFLDDNLNDDLDDGEFLENDDEDILGVDEIAQQECVQKNWADLFQSKDAQGFADRYSEDAVWLRCTNEVMQGRDGIRQGYDNWFKAVDRQDQCTNVVADDLSDIHTIGSASCNMYRNGDDLPIAINRYIEFSERIEGGFQFIFQINIEDKFEYYREW